jgi:hypothetical protein
MKTLLHCECGAVEIQLTGKALSQYFYDLPHYKGVPARFGGSDELMQW